MGFTDLPFWGKKKKKTSKTGSLYHLLYQNKFQMDQISKFEKKKKWVLKGGSIMKAKHKLQMP